MDKHSEEHGKIELFLVTAYANQSNQSQKPAKQDMLIEMHKIVLSHISLIFFLEMEYISVEISFLLETKNS